MVLQGTIYGSTKNLANQGSLKNHLLKDFLKKWFFVEPQSLKEPFKNRYLSVCTLIVDLRNSLRIIRLSSTNLHHNTATCLVDDAST